MKDYYFENKIFYKKNDFKKEKKTIIFVHGLSGSSSAWIPYEKRFEEKYNILSIDLRGHGKSFRPDKYQDYSMQQFSDDIYQILVYEKIEKSIIISHSMGSLVVLNFLKNHQDLVEKVILVSPSSNPSKRFFAKIIKPFLYLGNIIPNKKSGDHIDYSKFKNTTDWSVKRMFFDIRNTGVKSFLHSTRHAHDFNGDDILGKINVPILIVHGKKDSIFLLTHAKAMQAKLQNSKIEIIDDIDHIIVINKEVELSKIIEKFIGDIC